MRPQIERAGRNKRLCAYHLSDWLVPTRDVLNDRAMTGDGAIDQPLIRPWMESAGYRDMHQVEIFSAGNWWKRNGDEVLFTCRQCHEATS